MALCWRHTLLFDVEFGRVLTDVHAFAVTESDFAGCKLVFGDNFEEHGSVGNHFDLGNPFLGQHLVAVVVANQTLQLVVQNVVFA